MEGAAGGGLLVSIKPWDPGTGPPQAPGPGALIEWLRARRSRRPVLPGAVLFDMDGLLVDTEPLWTVAETELADRMRGVFTPQIKAAMIGQRLEVAVPILLNMLDTPASLAADPVVEGRWLLDRMTELFSAELPLHPGAAELLDAVNSAGVPAALVSSSFRQLVDAVLARLGAQRFVVTIAGDEVAESKPHPEPYLTAVRRLGLPAWRCVVIEDSEAGARAAAAAGCPCVLVPTLPPTQEGPWRVVGGLNEITVVGLGALTVGTR
ncbi:MAG: HAD family hydrolase [Frankiaceae bacterium]